MKNLLFSVVLSIFAITPVFSSEQISFDICFCEVTGNHAVANSNLKGIELVQGENGGIKTETEILASETLSNTNYSGLNTLESAKTSCEGILQGFINQGLCPDSK